ncbi:MAG: hypothetical protein JWM99_1967 [Verrucomicrobiales bacterium]|nr:hypothetical protein [Verrucomicrobiales bacterium]
MNAIQDWQPFAWFRTALKFFVLLVLTCSEVCCFAANPVERLYLACRADNDLFKVLQGNGIDCVRYDTPDDALAAAVRGAGMLILADGYPEKTTSIPTGFYDKAALKKVRLYVEYPESLPGLAAGSPKSITDERGVVSSDFFGKALPKMTIFTVNGCRYVPIEATSPLLVLAKVAGVDVAVFGLKDTPSAPLLFEQTPGGILVASTKLSQFVTGRYLPTAAWQSIWRAILDRLGKSDVNLQWNPTVTPSYTATEPLPTDVELKAFQKSADWVVHGRILRNAQWPDQALKWALHFDTVHERPGSDWPVGDGSLGLIEGYSSNIRTDGSQAMRYVVRHDVMAETAMLLALDRTGPHSQQHSEIARNLLDYDLLKSGVASGPRADPQSASYGMAGWSIDSPNLYWGDDNARALLGIAAAGASLKDARWNEAITRCLLGNFRTSGRRGFREEVLSEEALQNRGWESYWKGSPVKLSPHFESWLWACCFWAYDQTHFEPLLERSRTGLGIMMAGYPKNWFWCNRSGSLERARLLLALAWMIRVEDTPEHRAWLRTIATDLIALQDPSGAIRETIGDGGQGTTSNAEYGTIEASLIQNNGDPVSDLLYTCNFALIGLHEAALATGEPSYIDAEDRLAKFLCRIQVSSKDHPELSGAWCRGFNFHRWEYWASNADLAWGPWCIETGWTQPWIAATLALRQQKTSLWELLKSTRISEEFGRLRPQMLPDSALVVHIEKTQHAALAKSIKLAHKFSSDYPGGGPSGLTDGQLGSLDFLDGIWQGYHGVDLDATIDLGKPQSISTISVCFLQNVPLGIYIPKSVEVTVSNDGQNFESLSSVGGSIPQTDPDPFIKRIETDGANKTARFVRVHAQNLGVIPAGRARGEKAWLFADEIVVNPADNSNVLSR